MAFFGKKKKKSNQAHSASIITPGTFIKGEIRCDGNILINGELDGNIMSRSEVVVGKSGRVRGDIPRHKNTRLLEEVSWVTFTGKKLSILCFMEQGLLGRILLVITIWYLRPNAVF